MSHGTARLSFLAAALVVLAFVASQPAYAQQPTTRPKRPPQVEVTPDSVQNQMDAMMPMMGQMMMVMMKAMLDVAALPETADKMATFSKNFFDALMAKGFTRDEALRIVMATGLPTMPGQP